LPPTERAIEETYWGKGRELAFREYASEGDARQSDSPDLSERETERARALIPVGWDDLLVHGKLLLEWPPI
jgi:hypothetical protein